MKTKLLCAISSIILLACDKAGQGDSHQTALPATQASTPQSPVNHNSSQPAAPSALKIKGLYIGMDIQNVPDAMLAILAEQGLADFGFTDVIATDDGGQCVLMYTKSFLRAIAARMHERYGAARAQGKVDEEIRTSCINSDGVLIAKSGADGKVSKVEFNDVKDIFNAKGQLPAEFAANLIRQYQVSELKPNEQRTAWVFTSPDGARLEVRADEVLGIPMVRVYMSKTGL